MINSRWFHVGCKFPACTRVEFALDARRIRWSHVSCETVARLLYDGGTTGTTDGRYWRDIFVDLIRTNPTKHDDHLKADDIHVKWHDDTRCPQISCRGTIVPLSYLCGRGEINVWSSFPVLNTTTKFHNFTRNIHQYDIAKTLTSLEYYVWPRSADCRFVTFDMGYRS